MALSIFNMSLTTLPPPVLPFDERRFLPNRSFGQRFSYFSTPQQAAKGYFGRIERILHIKTPETKRVANELIHSKNAELLNFVRKETSSFSYIFKTSLGKVLSELEKSQESPHRKLLAREKLLEAETEAATLMKKIEQLSAKNLPKKESTKPLSSTTGTTPQNVGSQFQVNTESIGTQMHPTVTKVDQDDLLVVWKRNLQESYSTHAQRIRNDGSKIGSEFSLDLSGIGSGINDFSVIDIDREKFDMMWFAPPHFVYWQQFHRNGTEKGDKIYFGAHPSPDPFSVTTAKGESHKSIAAWTDYFDTICTQTFYQNDSQSPADCDPCPTALAPNRVLSATRLAEDKFFIGMLLDNERGNEIDGKLYNGDAQPLGPRFQVYSPSSGTIHSIASAGLTTGNFVVVWSEGYPLIGQVLRSDGSKEGATFQISWGEVEIMNPKVVGLINGKFVVVWQSLSQRVSNLYGQLFNEDRTKNGDPFKINSMPREDAQDPWVTKLEDDNFIVTWGGDSNIYGQIVNASPSTSSSDASSFLPSAIGGGVGGIVMIGGIAYLLRKKCGKSEERTALLDQSVKTPINKV